MNTIEYINEEPRDFPHLHILHMLEGSFSLGAAHIIITLDIHLYNQNVWLYFFFFTRKHTDVLHMSPHSICFNEEIRSILIPHRIRSYDNICVQEPLTIIQKD